VDKVRINNNNLKEEDPDLYEYIEDLKSTLIETFTSIAHGMCDTPDKSILIDATERIIQYLESLMTSE